MVGPAVVYTHIPKTGGSSFSSGLYRLFRPEGWVIAPDDNGDVSAILLQLREGGAVGGHVRYPAISPHAPDATYLASVRDPIDRIVSNYFFVIRHKGIEQGIYKGDLRRGFDAFYDIVIRRADRINLQCKFFSNSGTAEDAISVIISSYSLIWDTERTNEAWTSAHGMITNRLGIDGDAAAPLVPGYVAPRSEVGGVDGSRPESYRDFLGSGAVNDILEENAEDALLHRWVSERGGLITPRAWSETPA